MASYKPIPTLKAESFNTDPAQNTAAPPVGSPEGQLPSTVNDTSRHDKGSQREIYDWLEALDTGFGVNHEQQTNGTSGVNTIHPVATITDDGFMSAADKVTLDGLAAGSAPVTSVFGRQGVVIANSGDYTATQVSNAPAGNIAATSVQGAINELDTEKADSAAMTTALNGKVDTSYNLQTGAGISGGGDFTQSRTLQLAFQEFSETPIGDDDMLAFQQDGGTNHFKIRKADLVPSGFPAPAFTTTVQMPTGRDTVEQAHGLGQVPAAVQVDLVLNGIQTNFTAGDFYPLASAGYYEVSNARGWSIAYNGTNIRVNQDANPYLVSETGQSVTLIETQWQYRIRAWV
jgi:hypothetical protein